MLDGTSRIVAIGASGPYGSAQIAFMRAAGTQVVSAVSLGRGGESIDGVPVYDYVSDAVRESKADTAMIYTPAGGARQAVIDCADAGIRLAAVAAEFVPVLDALYAVSYARERGLTIVGPNTAGMASPERAMLGAIPPGFTAKGRVGVIGRSGTLTMTIARRLSAAGIGQSTIVHMGGDLITGCGPQEWLDHFLNDEETSVVAYVGEIGGVKEYQMLDRIESAHKPVVAFIVGRHAPPQKRMGHAGAFIGGTRETAHAKIAALSEAGALTCLSPSELIDSIGGSLVDAAPLHPRVAP